MTDGAVLPILHLNGYKIANPTILARITRRGTGAVAARLRWLDALLRRGSRARADASSDEAAALEETVERIKEIQRNARVQSDPTRPRWPMIVLGSVLQGLDRTEAG